MKLPPRPLKVSRISKEVSLLHSPKRALSASPKFMAPRQIGETRTLAVGASWRWRKSIDSGAGAGGNGGAMLMIVWEIEIRLKLVMELRYEEELDSVALIHVSRTRDGRELYT